MFYQSMCLHKFVAEFDNNISSATPHLEWGG